MKIKTTLLEEYVNFVDNTKKQNNFSRVCSVMLVFIVIFLTIIRLYRYNTK